MPPVALRFFTFRCPSSELGFSIAPDHVFVQYLISIAFIENFYLSITFMVLAFFLSSYACNSPFYNFLLFFPLRTPGANSYILFMFFLYPASSVSGHILLFHYNVSFMSSYKRSIILIELWYWIFTRKKDMLKTDLRQIKDFRKGLSP